ncbi:HAMP domain-containing protein [Clostridium tertium]|uniref:histidine kinase n=1 Tax=Clostridium tertium TaxID=1559 RepID=A0A6N3GA23_9CLOT
MFKSLKKKFTSIYLALVLLIIFVGVASTISTYSIRNYINGFISNNYKSIDSVNNMINAINNQDKAILIYLQGNKEEALNLFHTNDDEFYKWFYIEKSNITEDGELDVVDEINTQYIEFGKLFSSLQDISNGSNHEEIVEYYYNKIVPQFKVINTSLEKLSDLNEEIMFSKKESLKSMSKTAIIIVGFIAIIVSLVGGSIAMFLTNRYFNPINLLLDAIKSVKEGNLNKKAPIVYNDEIGELALEFNNMINRLYEYEIESKGSLQAEKDKSINIIKSISDPIILLDNSFKIKFINDKGKKFFNIYNDTYKDKNFLEVIPIPEAFKFIKGSLEDDNKTKIIEFTKNNKKYFFNLTINAIKISGEDVQELSVLFKDVTDLKELEAVKTEFIGAVSHELKTPLTSIMMGIGLINNNNIGELNKKQKDIVKTIGEDVQNLNELVSNLLKISEIQGNKYSFNIKENDMKKLLNDVVLNFVNQAEEKNIELKLDINEDLPLVMIDREKIKWVLNNLISNAIRYTEVGQVIVSSYKKSDKIYVQVADTGRGIPNNYLTKIFERFVRVEEFEIPEESTGLGLSIAKDIVEINGGEIWCESEVGVGSKFIFTIPISPEDN